MSGREAGAEHEYEAVLLKSEAKIVPDFLEKRIRVV